MKEVIINNLIVNIQKNYKYDEVKIKEIKYGLESIYLTLTKTIVIYAISIVFNYSYELTLLIIFYGLLRSTGFGVHAKKSIQCWISSIIIFVLLPLLIKYITLNYYAYLLLIPVFIIIIIYAPADTEKRPLVNNKKRKIFKIITIFLFTVYTSLILIVKNNTIINSLYFSMLLEAIVILPLVYKLMGLPYNNYLRYQKGVKK